MPREAPAKDGPKKWLFEAEKSRFLCPKSGFLTPKIGQLCPRKWLFKDHLSILSPASVGLTINTKQPVLLLMNIEFRRDENLARIFSQADTYVATFCFFPLPISLTAALQPYIHCEILEAMELCWATSGRLQISGNLTFFVDFSGKQWVALGNIFTILAPADLESLHPDVQIKVPGTLLNVAGALLQILGDQNGTCDFAIFSTWLSPLVSRKVMQGTSYGTIAGHIEDACAGQKEMLLAKTRWLFPLYGNNPPHWVLGWIDQAASLLHVFDSCPELESHMWAEPALVEVAETVFTTLGRPEINLEPWAVIKHSPPPLQRQMNGFSCGFFVIHAMCVVGNGESLSAVTNDQTRKVKSDTLDLIKDNLLLLRTQSESTAQSNNVVMADSGEDRENGVGIKVSLVPIVSPTPMPSGPDMDMDIDMNTRTQPTVASGEGPLPSKLSKKKAQPERKLKSKEEREETLKASEYAASVEPHRVLCAKCHSWIALHPTRGFKIENWTQHVRKCPQINGKVNVRIAVTKTLGTVTPSVTTFFDPGPIRNPPPKPVIVKEAKSCLGLMGGKYTEYIDRTETRSMGGVSVELRARLVRQLFRYKEFPALKSEDTVSSIRPSQTSVPANANDRIPSAEWTHAEHQKADKVLRGFARWEVDFGKKTKNREAELPLEEQHQIQMDRAKYSNRRLHDLEGRNLELLLRDPVTFKALKTLEKGESTECFLQLYEATLNGKLKDYQTVMEMCQVVAEVLKRKDTKTMSGIRYPPHYLNFTILMRGYGGNSARQYGILAGEIPLPSMRHVSSRALVPKSADALHNPYLIFENMARVKRLVDSIKYSGPVAVAGDCTKVRKRLTFSNDFGGHILGSVWALENCIAEDPDDIERVTEGSELGDIFGSPVQQKSKISSFCEIVVTYLADWFCTVNEITKAKAEATQVRAILIKVPLPHIPPQVVALLPTNGTDDANKIFEQHLKLLAMAAELSLPVISFSADGAASELSAQRLMDDHETSFPPITYDYPLYGIHLKAPVLKTGPVASGQDAGHGKKTARNGPQSGARTEDLGEDVIVNNTLVDLQKTGVSGLLPSDIKNVDKQDDGPARRLFHVLALRACVIGEGDATKIRILFDPWLNRTMTVANRVLAVLRARFFLHFWRAHIVQMSNKYPDLYSTARSFITAPSFHIFNRLCDSLLLLVIIYGRRYPDQPFCPWLLGTEFVEHFFGLARMMLPNFTWAEFIKLVQHVMVRQQILLSGSFKEKRERNARVGYVLDFDASPLTAEDRKLAEVTLTDRDIDSLVELGFQEATLICTQLLHIPAPKPMERKPLDLAPLGVPAPKARLSGASEDFDSDDDDYDDEEEDHPPASDPIPDHLRSEESRGIASATHGAARYAALCEDYENAVTELNSQPEPATPAAVFGPPPPPHSITSTSSPSISFRSEIIDANGKLSISMMLQARLHWQAGTTTRSEKVSQIDSKYALSRIARAVGAEQDDDAEPEKMTLQEASSLTRVLQDQNVTIQESKPVKYREIRWKGIAAVVQRLVDANVLPNIIAKNVQQLNPLAVGSMTVMWSGTRFYIGEVLDVIKKGANGRYGSLQSSPTVSGLSFLSLRVYLPLTTGGEDDDDDEDQESGDLVAPLFSCYHKHAGIRLSTHAKIEQLLFNLGTNIFERVEDRIRHRTLKPHAAQCWISLTKPGVVSKEVKKVTLKWLFDAQTAQDRCLSGLRSNHEFGQKEILSELLMYPRTRNSSEFCVQPPWPPKFVRTLLPT
ncbi:hypothetical protein C8R45DRAFT_924266 [Mycena sanguinolenta]|nr:hypothetical protein C8R45DRAFT_924266 [Mycena sanguinolenta]